VAVWLRMPLVGALEVAVCLERFKNVDLHSQGLYRVSVSLGFGPGGRDADGRAIKVRRDKSGAHLGDPHHLWASPGARATPYAVFAPGRDGAGIEGVSTAAGRFFWTSKVDMERDVYYGRPVHVRYVEEERRMKDGVQFRIEVDPLALVGHELGLCFCLERAKVENFTGESHDDENLEFELLCERHIVLNVAAQGIHEYVPVIFDHITSTGFALLETSVHACLTSVKYEPEPHGNHSECNDNSPQNAADVTLERFLGSLVNNQRGVDSSVVPENILLAARNSCLFPMRSSYASLAKLLTDLLALKGDPDVFEAPCSIPIETLEDLEQLSSLPTEPYEAFVAGFSKELEETSAALVLGWHNFIQLVKAEGRPTLEYLKRHWIAQATERSGESIIREKQGASMFRVPSPASRAAELRKIAAKIRLSMAQIRHFQKERVEDSELLLDLDALPVVFEQRYLPDDKLEDNRSDGTLDTPPSDLELEKESFSSGSELNLRELQLGASDSDLGDFASGDRLESDSDVDLLFGESRGLNRSATEHYPARKPMLNIVVFVHGFLGSSWDLRTFRNYMSIVVPNTLTLLSSANENDTDSDLSVQGYRLAREVHEFIKEAVQSKRQSLGRLSFVCHSIGSITARAALTEALLHPYIPHLYSFVSFASPHLGSRGMSSPLVKYGMWAVQQWRKAKALAQLSMTDDSDIRSTFLYKLSKAEHGLHSFKSVLLISASQDKYVPHYSTRIEPLRKGPGITSEEVTLAAEMATNLLQRMDPTRVLRLELAFEFDTVKVSRIDKILGRAAHVKILDSPALSWSLLLQYRETLFGTS